MILHSVGLVEDREIGVVGAEVVLEKHLRDGVNGTNPENTDG